jgi:hypothetical protein
VDGDVEIGGERGRRQLVGELDEAADRYLIGGL